MATKPGDFCARCGAKSVKRVQDGKVYYDCPNRHGIQRIEDEPAEPVAEEPAETDADRVDDVAGAVDNGPGSHN